MKWIWDVEWRRVESRKDDSVLGYRNLVGLINGGKMLNGEMMEWKVVNVSIIYPHITISTESKAMAYVPGDSAVLQILETKTHGRRPMELRLSLASDTSLAFPPAGSLFYWPDELCL